MALEAAGAPASAPLCAAQSMVAVPDEAGETLMKLIDGAGRSRDVQNVVWQLRIVRYPDGKAGRIAAAIPGGAMATPPVQIVVRRNGLKVRTVSRLNSKPVGNRRLGQLQEQGLSVFKDPNGNICS